MVAIQGKLEEASLPDILQLLALGKKTGCLTLLDGTLQGQIYLDTGRITYAAVANRRDRLGDMLVKSGRITREQLAEAMDQQNAGHRRLGEILVASGRVARAELERFAEIQIEEAVYFLFTWRKGNFTFESNARPEGQDFLASINPEGLLLEGARRVDEWSLIEKKIPSFEMVFRVDRARLSASDVTLTEEQRKIVPLLDGQHDVNAVIEATGLAEFDAGKALYGLVSAGFAQLVERRATIRHLDYRELLAYLVHEAEFADPERRKQASRHIVDCKLCAPRLKEIHVRRTQASGALQAVDAPPDTAPRAGPATSGAPAVLAPPPPRAHMSGPRRSSGAKGKRDASGITDRRRAQRRHGDRRRAAAGVRPGGLEERRTGGDRRRAERRLHDRLSVTLARAQAAAIARATSTKRATERPRRDTGPRHLPPAAPDRTSPAPDRTSPAPAPAEVKAPAASPGPAVTTPSAAAAPAPSSAAAPAPPETKAAAAAASPGPAVATPSAAAAPAPPSAPAAAPPETKARAAPAAPGTAPPARAPAPTTPPGRQGKSREIEWIVTPEESGVHPVVPPPATTPRIPAYRRPAPPPAPAPPRAPAATAEPPRPTEKGKEARPETQPLPETRATPQVTPARARGKRWLVAAATVLAAAGAGAFVTTLIGPRPGNGAPAAVGTTGVSQSEPTAPAGEPVPSIPEPAATLPRGAVAGPASVPPRREPAQVANADAPARRAEQPAREPPAVQAEPTRTSAGQPAPTERRPTEARPESPALVAPARPAEAAPAPAAPPAPSRIRGTVRNAATGAPLAGVRLAIAGTSIAAVTDAAGTYELAGVSPGAAVVDALLEGYVSGKAIATVVSGAVQSLDIALEAVPPPPPTAPAAPKPVTALKPDDELAGGRWTRIDMAEAEGLLGQPLAVIEGLWVESVSRAAGTARPRVRVAQLTESGERVALVETRSGAPAAAGDRPRVTALRIMPPSEAYPVTTGTGSFGNLLVTATTALPADSLRALLSRLVQTPR